MYRMCINYVTIILWFCRKLRPLFNRMCPKYWWHDPSWKVLFLPLWAYLLVLGRINLAGDQSFLSHLQVSFRLRTLNNLNASTWKTIVIVGYLSGSIITTTLVFISAHMKISPWLFLLSSVPSVLSGGTCALITGIYCYISDMAKEKARALRYEIIFHVISFRKLQMNDVLKLNNGIIILEWYSTKHLYWLE